MIVDTHKQKENGYLGNPNVKRDGIDLSFTPEQVSEYIKCSNDPIYFSETYLKVIHLDHGLVPFKLYPYQKEMFKNYNNNRFSITLACRQSGKCQSINTIVKVRNKQSGLVEEITVGDLYERHSSSMQ